MRNNLLRILAIGDAHIPRRAKEIPIKITEKLETLKRELPFDYTFFTGDLVNAPEFLDFLYLNTKADLFIVMGNMDYYNANRNSPAFRQLTISLLSKNFTFGLTHGAQISPRGDHDQLELLSLEKGYNILISGHTHKEEVHLTKKGILLINPGSVTGAWSFVATQIPSFVLLSIEKTTAVINVELFRLNKTTNQISRSIKLFKFNGERIESF